MGKTTGIEWADATWNPWQGCHKVSAGCKNCYMFRDKERWRDDPNTVIRSAPATFNKPLAWRESLRIFVCSWSDFFIEEADEWREDAWQIIKKAYRHTYLLLTKRPGNIRSRLPRYWDTHGGFWSNVWLGVSAENQEMAEQRIPLLQIVPARRRFLSLEPLLEYVDLREHVQLGGIDWVIIGGESGPGCRPMYLDWAEHIVYDMDCAGVPVFVKQLGGWPDKRTDMSRWPDSLRVRQFPD